MNRLKICLAALALGTALLLAGEPPSQPILCLETGMHTARITRVAADTAGQSLVTAADDKTLRVWDTATGELQSTLRPPIADGDEGRLSGCALSPDGSLLAAGGTTGLRWDGSECIYLFERVSGRILRRITGLPHPLEKLAFSPDGRRLAVCLWKGGMRLFDVADGRELRHDKDYGDQSYGADFDQAGRLVTSCWDGILRLYDADGRLQHKVKVGGQPYAVRFSPDGTAVAVGFTDGPRVQVLSGSDLSLQFLPDTTGLSTGLGQVAWALDGQTLYAGGKSERTDGTHLIRAWSQGGRGQWQDWPSSGDTLMDLAPLPGGRLAWAGADPAWGVLGGVSRLGETADFRNWQTGLNLDASGGRVAFGLSRRQENPASFEVASRTFAMGPAQGLLPPVTSAPGMEIIHWRNDYEPKLNGSLLPLEPYERSRRLAMAPNDGFLLGADFNLYAFDPKGVQRWKRPAPDMVEGVNISADGALGVAAYGDGTIRWHRMTDGKELLAFFPHKDGRRWVAWTPSGYYDCSPGGEDLIGWHLNRGKDQAADFFPASRFRAQFYRPDVVANVLAAQDEAVAVAKANETRAHSGIQELQAILPPVIHILSPANGAQIEAGTVTLRASVRSANRSVIDAVWAAVDGRRVEARGLQVQPSSSADGEKIYKLEVPVPTEACAVSVFAQSGSAVSEAAVVRLAGTAPPGPAGAPPAAAGFTIQPKLYVLAVGVSTYQLKDLALDFPAKDAKDLAAAFAAQKGRLFRDVEVKLLTDGAASKDNVMDGLEWLERQVTAKDVAVMFLAGHGINDTSGLYYFLPSNADPERIKRTMVADYDVRSTLAKLPGKVLFFLDTCHSGNILGGVKQRGSTDLNGFINDLASAENGVVVFSASTGKQASLESKAWNNGAFTKAVVEGLAGKADYQHTGRVTVNMLDLYISERVKALTQGAQAPTTAKPSTVPDFPVAIVK